MSNGDSSKALSIKWDVPVQKNGAVTIPVKIREALNNPKFIRFEIANNIVTIRRIDKLEEGIGHAVQEK